MIFTTLSLRKLATLRIALEGITNKRRNSYRSHHTSSETTDLATLRDIYVELAALRSYCDLNQTGFYKIIKKYDKTMEVGVEMYCICGKFCFCCILRLSYHILFYCFTICYDDYRKKH